jgi:2'-5' RNA ligase
VLWAGLAGEVEPLRDLHRALSAHLREAGFPPDPRFSPHVTLARFHPARRRPPDLGPVVADHVSWSGGPIEAAEVVVYASALRPEGPVYTPLARLPLAQANHPTTP